MTPDSARCYGPGEMVPPLHPYEAMEQVKTGKAGKRAPRVLEFVWTVELAWYARLNTGAMRLLPTRAALEAWRAAYPEVPVRETGGPS